MLLPEQVIPFLSHDDPIVREHAERYFHQAHDPAPLTADLVWDAIDRLDPKLSAGRLITLLKDLPQSDSSTDRLLAAFAEERHLDVEEDLWDALEAIDFDQLARHRERILAKRDLIGSVPAHLETRLKLADLPVGALWDKLEREVKRSAGKYWDQIDHAITDRLVEALARHGSPVADRAMTIVAESAGGDDALDDYAIQILKRLRHRPALDVLLKAFAECDEEDDVRHEQLMFALPKVGGADVVAPIEEQYPAQGEAYRIYAAGVLGRVRAPESEAALVRLLDRPDQVDMRTQLGIALADLCPSDGLPTLQRIVLNREYDPKVADLKQDLVACAMMAGIDFPELGQLRAEAIAAEIERERRFERLLDGKGGPDDEFFEDDEFDNDLNYPDLPPALDDRAPRVIAPIRNDQPKVGRNDPCPCGSGKKYKKCCLSKAI